MRHAHGKISKSLAKRALLLQLVSQRSQATKKRSRVFRIVEEWRQGHQSQQVEARARANGRNQFRQLVFFHAVLGRFVTEIYLDQHRQLLTIQLATDSIESPYERDRIQRVNYIEEFNSPPRFV